MCDSYHFMHFKLRWANISANMDRFVKTAIHNITSLAHPAR